MILAYSIFMIDYEIIIELKNKFYSNAEIHRLHGWSEITIRKVIDRFVKEGKLKPPKEHFQDTVIRLKNEGLSNREIAEATRTNLNTVGKYVQKFVGKGKINLKPKKAWNEGKTFDRVIRTCANCGTGVAKFILSWQHVEHIFYCSQECRRLDQQRLKFLMKHAEIEEVDKKIAKIFCLKYHYIKRFPVNVTKCYGLFFEDSLIGVSVFGSSGNPYSASFIDGMALELLRFCLVDGLPKNSASYFLSRTMKAVKEDIPDLKALISYSDDSTHFGTIYKATNWESLGTSKGTYYYVNENGDELPRQKIYRHCKSLQMLERDFVQKLDLKRVDTSTKTKFVFYY